MQPNSLTHEYNREFAVTVRKALEFTVSRSASLPRMHMTSTGFTGHYFDIATEGETMENIIRRTVGVLANDGFVEAAPVTVTEGRKTGDAPSVRVSRHFSDQISVTLSYILRDNNPMGNGLTPVEFVKSVLADVIK